MGNWAINLFGQREASSSIGLDVFNRNTADAGSESIGAKALIESGCV